MKLQLLLLLFPLLLPSVSAQTFSRFVKKHSYSKNIFPDCNRDLNPVLKSLNQDCPVCNSFILGDLDYNANISQVSQVCSSGGGSRVSENMFRSSRSFRVVTCSQTQTSGTRPPNCDYEQSDIETRAIFLSCNQKNLPTRFNPC